MSLNKYIKDALTYEDYIDLLEKNLPLHQLHYKKFTISDEWLKEIKMLNSYQVLVITEPWCGDSLALLPVVRKICEARSDWELKIILRDKNPELIDQYLTNGGRAIPIFLFLDQKGDLVSVHQNRPLYSKINHTSEIAGSFYSAFPLPSALLTPTTGQWGRGWTRECW